MRCVVLFWLLASGAFGQAVVCDGGALAAGNGEDLEVKGACTVGAGTYRYGAVNIYGGGKLTFADAKIDFWASSILVENAGTLAAGTPSAPMGTQGGVLTIHIYGKDQGAGGAGVICKSDVRCGVPEAIWNSEGASKLSLPGGVSDYFYAYKPLMFDGGNPNAYFGYKVLAVGYGGSLQLYGAKGATYVELADSDPGRSWSRLDAHLAPGAKSLRVDRPVDWQPGDKIVVTTTDYLPGHSEELTIESLQVVDNTTTIQVREAIQYPHNGQVYDLTNLPAGVGPDPHPGNFPTHARFAETRAAVALLTRSIRIVSAGNELGQDFPAEIAGEYFGAHTVLRQGFQSVQIRGVEFYQMGQGGKMGHYPVHFHLARQTPEDTMIVDSSVHDSMTRWVTVHGSHGVLVQRNVGYKSIGHGFYLEDGSEINNRFYSNIGILARGAVDNPQNPRKVPGILAAPYPSFDSAQEEVPIHSDVDHPSIFWITNGWNEFVYNMAAGAGTCGVCYWFVPASISGPSRMQKWEGYAGMQMGADRASMTPMKRFEGNYCTTAMNSLHTIGNTTPCKGVVNEDPGSNAPQISAIANPYPIPDSDSFYPKVDTGGGRFPTLCPEGADCSTIPKCGSNATENCAVSVIDRYTTSFNWAETNFSAVWLRPQWYLFLNSVITDVQNGGLTFVTGGGYTKADVVDGHWALARKSAFIGNAQLAADSPFAENAGPINPRSPLSCATQTASSAPVGNFCLLANEGVSYPMSNFGINQRLFNIYDGPAYQDSNAYLSIGATKLEDCTPQNFGACNASKYLYGRMMAVPKSASGGCYLPNAAIAWKQPNGFFYPPAFHSTNLFFQDVDIRHYVIQPLFTPGSLYKTDVVKTPAKYCTWNDAMFTGFTDIDRQTELNDDDGSLTGLVDTVSVNQDAFFRAPVQTAQCASDIKENTPPGTAVTSPYQYVTTAMIPECGLLCADWSIDCAGPGCFGVPLYRQYALPGETEPVSIRMAGQATAQRSSLTMNGGRYYIDTTVSADAQRASGANLINAFRGGETYYTMLLYATPQTKQTYQMYVGPGFNPASDVFVARGDLGASPVKFRKGDAWPASWPQPQYDAATGLLTVTMDMSFGEFQTQYQATKSGRCGPKSFCSLDAVSGECGSSLDTLDALYAESKAVCSRWAAKDVDCPSGGCYAFGVTLPSGFSAGAKANLPPPRLPFPADGPLGRTFVPATAGVAGQQCYYSAPPLK